MAPNLKADETYTYVGSYTKMAGTCGINVYAFNTTTGSLRHLFAVPGTYNASFLAMDHQKQYLYSVCDIMDSEGKLRGAVASYRMNSEDGSLQVLNHQFTEGGRGCHLIVDHSGQYLLMANYSGGNVSTFPLHDNGEIGVRSDLKQHIGSGTFVGRQESPHPHSIWLDPANEYALVPDLGMDQIVIYKLDLSTGRLITHNTVALHAGAGPRHLVFHPSGTYAYVINELDSTVTAYQYDQQNGALAEIQTITTLPAEFTGTSWCADIHMDATGSFLYGSNRGHDSIVVYAITSDSGELEWVEHTSTQGQTPRNFAISTNGNYLLAANQDSGTIVSFLIDKGRLEATGHITKVPQAVCIIW